MSWLSISTDFAVAALSLWLGAVVATRAGARPDARVFVWLAALLAGWSCTRVMQAFTTSPTVRDTADGVQIVVAPFLIAATLHFALVVVSAKPPAALRGLLGAAYALAGIIGLLHASDRGRAIAIRPPYRPIFGMETPLFGWLWIAFRAAVMLLAVWWVWRAWQRAGPGGAGRERLTALLGAVIGGGAGGTATILLAETGTPQWPGVALIAAGAGCAAYAVFAGGLFQPAGAARRSFRASVGTGVLTAGYVVALLVLEQVARRAFALETPLLSALALVLTIALFDPVREWTRSRFARQRERHDRVYAVLLGAIGGELLTATRPRDAIAPALTQLCRALGIETATVRDASGTRLAVYGERGEPANAEAMDVLELPLVAGPHTVGTLTVGAKRDGAAYTPAEVDRLNLAASYIATSLHVDDRLTTQAAALATLTTERASLAVRETALANALVPPDPAPAPMMQPGLRVWALGPLRVERDGERIERWGGAKAGTRQAEAVFAYLYDRAERGVAKDEFLDLIWPEIEPDKADLAFHRTLGGLRRTLEPHVTRGSEAKAITYRNDRYRLDPAAVAWSDVDAFRAALATASAAPDDRAEIEAYEAARVLYRGDYLDDCPFYGDSEQVEERRGALRGQCVDVLVALGERHAERGDLPAAAAAFRDALALTGDDCPRADAGLARLGVAA